MTWADEHRDPLADRTRSSSAWRAYLRAPAWSRSRSIAIWPTTARNSRSTKSSPCSRGTRGRLRMSNLADPVVQSRSRSRIRPPPEWAGCAARPASTTAAVSSCPDRRRPGGHRGDGPPPRRLRCASNLDRHPQPRGSSSPRRQPPKKVRDALPMAGQAGDADDRRPRCRRPLRDRPYAAFFTPPTRPPPRRSSPARKAVVPRRRQQPGPRLPQRRGTPRFITSARGAYLIDADGREYVDLIGSWGPMILGHTHPTCSPPSRMRRRAASPMARRARTRSRRRGDRRAGRAGGARPSGPSGTEATMSACGWPAV